MPGAAVCGVRSAGAGAGAGATAARLGRETALRDAALREAALRGAALGAAFRGLAAARRFGLLARRADFALPLAFFAAFFLPALFLPAFFFAIVCGLSRKRSSPTGFHCGTSSPRNCAETAR